MAEEDKRKKLPANHEAMQRRVEWENKEEEARKVHVHYVLFMIMSKILSHAGNLQWQHNFKS